MPEPADFLQAAKALNDLCHTIVEAYEGVVPDDKINVIRNCSDILYSLEQEMTEEDQEQ